DLHAKKVPIVLESSVILPMFWVQFKALLTESQLGGEAEPTPTCDGEREGESGSVHLERERERESDLEAGCACDPSTDMGVSESVVACVTEAYAIGRQSMQRDSSPIVQTQVAQDTMKEALTSSDVSALFHKWYPQVFPSPHPDTPIDIGMGMASCLVCPSTLLDNNPNTVCDMCDESPSHSSSDTPSSSMELCFNGGGCESDTYGYSDSYTDSSTTDGEGEREGEGEGEGVDGRESGYPFVMLKGSETPPLAESVSLSRSEGERERETVMPYQDALCLSVSERETQILKASEIEYFPVMLYTKLDIVGFTRYCSESAGVVSLLNVLFTAFDAVVELYAGSGVAKVKTVGDAYELMRPFTASQVRDTSVESFQKAVSDMVECSYWLVHCALGVFSSLGVNLSVRCGIAVGPAFASVLGSVRVSYDIFGMAPSRARAMEGISPVGCVTMCAALKALLRGVPGFHYGDVVTPSRRIVPCGSGSLEQWQKRLDAGWDSAGIDKDAYTHGVSRLRELLAQTHEGHGETEAETETERERERETGVMAMPLADPIGVSATGVILLGVSTRT
ncbi:hypothetical protein KIPB_008894, partial [Kipferlia bialata]